MKEFMRNHTLLVLFSIVVVIGVIFSLTQPRAFLFAAVPDAPTNLVATPGDGQVTLTWSAAGKGDAAEGYFVRRNNPNTTINTFSTATSYTVTGLTNGVSYNFSVAGHNRDGTGAYTAIVSSTPQVVASVPNAPVFTSATPGDGEISLVWGIPNDNGSPLNAYRLSVQPEGGQLYTVNLGVVNSYTVDSLTNGTLYTFTIMSRNAVGQGPSSDPITATPAGVVSTPGMLTINSAMASNGQIALSWNAPADDGGSDVTGYTISYTPSGGSEITTSVGLVQSRTLTGLTNGTQYTIKIAAQNIQGLGTYSATSTATPFTTPSVPVNLSVTPGDGSLSLAWEAPNNGGADLTGYIISYTPLNGSEQFISANAGDITYILDGLTNGLTYSIKISASNVAGSGSFTSNVQSSPDQDVAPSVVGIPTVSVGPNSATITWITNKHTTTRVDFGLLQVNARSTTEINTGVRVLSHTTTVSNLVACTTYSYRVSSRDVLERTTTSSTRTFTTLGCEGEATVNAFERDTISVESGGELDFRNTVDAKLTIPANVKENEENIIFQIKKLEKSEVRSAIGVPDSGKEWLGNHAYKLSAYISEEEEVDGFDAPVTVTIEYGRQDIEGIKQDTLSIYHFHDEEEGWHILENCINTFNLQTGLGVISCTTPNFSVFGLFGEPEPSSSSGGSTVTGSFLPISSIQADSETTITSIDNNELSVDIGTVMYVFTQDLWRGINNSLDVFNLQKFLNAQGFILAEEGPGSPGRETSYFGPRTQNALKRFQEAYAGQILIPIGLTKPTGYFGIITRTFIQENF